MALNLQPNYKKKKPSCEGKGLKDFLIMPAQRIPRYLMLLSDLLRKTPEDHPDYSDLIEAKKKFSELSDKVDEDLEDFKNLEAVMRLSASLIFKGKDKHFLLVEPHRRFSQEVEITYIVGNPDDNSDSAKDGVLLIFNDIVLLCMPHRDKKRVQQVIHLDSVKFSSKLAREENALYFEGKNSTFCIWSKKKMNLFEIITSIQEQRNQGKNINLATVPIVSTHPISPNVTKKPRGRTLTATQKSEQPKILRSHSSFSLAHAADLALLKRKAASKAQTKVSSISSSVSMDKIDAVTNSDLVVKGRSKSDASKEPVTPRTRRRRRENKRKKRNSLTVEPIPHVL